MATQQTLDSIVLYIRDRLIDAKIDANESHKLAMNSYGAGYDAGVVYALEEILTEITGEPAA